MRTFYGQFPYVIHYFKVARILHVRKSFGIETNEWSVQNSESFPGVESSWSLSSGYEDHGAPLITELMHFHASTSPVSKCEACLPPLFLSSLRETLREQMCHTKQPLGIWMVTCKNVNHRIDVRLIHNFSWQWLEKCEQLRIVIKC